VAEVASEQALPMLRIALARNGATAVVQLEGELDVATAGQAAEVLEQVAAEPVGTVIIEAGGLQFLDASGLAPLLRTANRLPPGAVRMRNVRPPVLRLLRLLDLGHVFGLEH
jgi:anti-anti-sigma factor